jgi:uncharacterized protein (TIGR02271 family)
MTAANLDPEVLRQSTVEGMDGENIGRVGQVYLDNETGEPNWVTVKTGWFGTSESFVPLDAATVESDTIRVPYDKDRIKDAPHYEAGVPLTESDEQELYSHYGVGGRAAYDTTATQAGAAGEGTDFAGTAQTGEGGEFLTRSEEQLHVGTEKVETGRARLRKYVVTEDQTVTVPVSHEEVRLVREPVQPGEDADSTIEEAVTDVTLTEERIVVSKETVPVEKVSLGTETVTEQQDVTETVRKEQIEFDGDSDTVGADGISDVDEVPTAR